MLSGYDANDGERGEINARMTFGGGIMRIFLLAGDLRRIFHRLIQQG
jgi:hypothetical protein